MKNPQALIDLLKAAEAHVQGEISTATKEWTWILPYLLKLIQDLRKQVEDLANIERLQT